MAVHERWLRARNYLTSSLTSLLLGGLVDLLCLLLCRSILVLHHSPPLHILGAMMVKSAEIWVS